MEILKKEQLLALYNRGLDAVLSLIDMLYKTIDAYKKRIKHLESILSKHSHNYNKPHSSDGFKKTPKKIINLRKKSGIKPGDQPSHKWITLGYGYFF